MTGLAAFVALAVGLTAWFLLRPDTYVAAPVRGTGPAAVRPDLAAQALDAMAAAVARRAASDPASPGDAADPAARDLLTAIVSNAEALDVRGFSARYVDETGPADADGRWRAAVDMSWRFQGFDARPVTVEVPVTFAVRGGRALIEAIGGAGGRSPLWLSGPVDVRRAGGVLVLGPRPDAVSRYMTLAERAVPVVRRVVTSWRPRLVVEVPASAAGLDGALGASPGTYAGVAAVTASVDGSTRPDSPVHVYLNPEVMGGLGRSGAQVVLSHEVTHLATGAATAGQRPVWLTEGFADYVALRDVRLPLSTTAGQILAQVRREGPPSRLPDQSDFDSRSERFGAEYEAAWLVCRVLADAGGEAALVSLYDRVGAGEPVASALRGLFGFGIEGLTRRWQERLSDWAR